MIGLRSDDAVMHRFRVRERCAEMLWKTKKRRLGGYVVDEKKNLDLEQGAAGRVTISVIKKSKVLLLG